jgi:hypothetical protein
MAPQQLPLLALPGELSNQIYHEDLLLGADSGYGYEYEVRKLRTVDIQPIDLNLICTCRLIAYEIRGLALHKVTFSTVHSEGLRSNTRV